MNHGNSNLNNGHAWDTDNIEPAALAQIHKDKEEETPQPVKEINGRTD